MLPLLRAVRPRQWTKNLSIFAAAIFAREIFHPQALLHSSVAVLAFCALASSVYLLNDWVDRDRDRLHPEKRHRPIASGQVSGAQAAVLAFVLVSVGVALSLWLGQDFATFSIGYVVLQVLYTYLLKHIVILDVMIIALGFLIRVVSGGVVIQVPVSNWLYLCTVLLALFLGFAKRRHELSSLQADALGHRANLSEYSVSLLDQLLSVVAAACIVAYGLYTVAHETVEKVGSDRLKFTVPFVLYGIFRYLYLIHRKDAGGSPEKVLLSDRPLIIDLLLFIVVAGLVLYR
jgi:4-hydroxybenzoate polyprenyltransferase